MSVHPREAADGAGATDPPHATIAAPKPSAADPSDNRINILLVDDEPKNLTVLESILDDPRYRLVLAESADDALLALVKEEFALLVLDIQMPGMNGFELAQMIKQRKKTAGVPIIFLTAFYSEDQHVLEGYGTGAVDYLHKPINPTILRSKVAVFAELHGKSRELAAANRALQAEIDERKLAQDALSRLARELEQRVADRTDTLARANAALVESEERLQLAQSAGGIGVWDWNIVSDEMFWSEAMWLIYGIEPIRPAKIRERWQSLLHPDDREYILAQLAAKLASQDSLFRSEFRVIAPDGTIRCVENTARITRDRSGKAIRMSGVNVDVTEKNRTADRLRLSEQRFQLALRNSRILVYTTDRDLRYTWTSGPYPALMPEQVLGRRDEELFTPEQAAPLVALKQRVLASGVGEHGSFGVEIDGTRREYDLTVEPLSNSNGEVIGLTVAAMEISELKAAEAALRHADRRKDEFLATLAHELRNPLAPIRTAVQILRARGPAIPELQWARDVIDRQAQQLTRLVDDLLDVSRITTGKLALRKERIDLETIVESAVETSRPLIEQCGHQLRIDLPPERIALWGDATRLAQVLSNLLNNAAKYTEPGGRIALTASLEGSAVRLSVKDTGAGIPQELLPLVFELFNQGEQKLERSQGGLGVGLTLVKRLLELHGGQIEARSEGPGKGSEFIIRLPLAGEDQSVGAIDVDDAIPVSERRLRILVVDDNKDNADCLRIVLAQEGHDTRIAYDGVQAIEVAEAFRPEIVLLDLGMPHLSGYEVCAHLRKQSWGKNLFLVAQTGWGKDDDRARTRAAGFDRHLIKPVKHDVLMKLLAEFATQVNGLANREYSESADKSTAVT